MYLLWWCVADLEDIRNFIQINVLDEFNESLDWFENLKFLVVLIIDFECLSLAYQLLRAVRTIGQAALFLFHQNH